jgi:ketosteroid isomerase-like protein
VVRAIFAGSRSIAHRGGSADPAEHLDGYVPRMTTLDTDSVEQLASRLIAAISDNDIDALRGVYASDVVIWHNFDQVEQSLEDNLKVMMWMAKRMPDKHYDEIRRQPTPNGFVQQHVLRGTAPDGTAVEIPACLIVTIADGRITRLEEYLDTKDAAALSRR